MEGADYTQYYVVFVYSLIVDILPAYFYDHIITTVYAMFCPNIIGI